MDQVGRYQILRELGRGGMSSVVLAYDPHFERQVAIKLLPREFLHDPSFRARFEREAKVIARLEHPAIVPVYDFGEEDAQPYLVMRYMAGGTLKSRLAAAPLQLQAILPVLVRIASALDEAHEQGIVHRDVKPDNILFDPRGDAYLSDFGIVKLAQQTATFTGGAALGTPAYMSPEQARGEAEIDGRSDVYALGAILYELLAGRPPYEAENPMGLAVKHIIEPVPRIRQVRPEVPDSVESVIVKAMAKDREARFESAGALVAVLGKAMALETQPSAAPDAVTLAGVAEGELSASGPPEDEMPAPRPAGPAGELSGERTGPGRAWPVWGLAGVAALVLLMGSLALFSARGSQGSPPTADPTRTRPVAAVAPTEAASPTPDFPPVVGADPSDRVGAFYYPWYGNPVVNGAWMHWESHELSPPQDVASDFYPLLGPYSSLDPMAVAQHFAWLRSAGVGVIITSWWGQGSYEDKAVPLVLQMAERYGVKVAFHIEPYEGRTAERLVADIEYLYRLYGDHPGFFRAEDSSRWSPSRQSKGVFFVWELGIAGGGGPPVEAEYWQGANDAAHELPEGALIIGNRAEPDWIDRAHFDGLYNYITLDLEESRGFSWAAGLPPGTWYVPSITPGFSARRVGYPQELHLARGGGATFVRQFEAAVEPGVEPRLLTITSFNEWHEGTQIEPASAGAVDGEGSRYESYGELGPEAYLTQTREIADRLLTTTWPEGARLRIRLSTTSDWTEFHLPAGIRWTRPEILSASEEVNWARVEPGGQISINQSLERAQSGGEAEIVVDLTLLDLEPQGDITFVILRGSLGRTRLELHRLAGEEEIPVETILWGGVVEGNGENPRRVTVAAADLLGAGP